MSSARRISRRTCWRYGELDARQIRSFLDNLMITGAGAVRTHQVWKTLKILEGAKNMVEQHNSRSRGFPTRMGRWARGKS